MRVIRNVNNAPHSSERKERELLSGINGFGILTTRSVLCTCARGLNPLLSGFAQKCLPSSRQVCRNDSFASVSLTCVAMGTARAALSENIQTPRAVTKMKRGNEGKVIVSITMSRTSQKEKITMATTTCNYETH